MSWGNLRKSSPASAMMSKAYSGVEAAGPAVSSGAVEALD
jgi:hypothetical protein